MADSSAYRRYLPAAAGLLGTAAVLAATRHGIAVSPDSVQYIAASRSILSLKGFISFDGGPLVLWPPLYPALLGVLGEGGIGPLIAARWINAISYGLLAFASVRWLAGNVRRPGLVLAGAVIVLFSVPLLRVSQFALSDTLFFTLAFLSVYWADEFLRGDGKAPFYLSALFAALSCLDRYIGVTVAISCALLILFRTGAPARRRLREAAVFGALSLLPLATWLGRNYALTGTPAGERGAAPGTLSDNVLLAMDAVSGWVLPQSVPPPARMLAALLLPAVFLFAMNKRGYASSGLSKTRPFFLFALVYLAALVVFSTYAAIDRIETRLVSPAFVPVAVSFCAAADTLMQGMRKGAGGLAASFVLCLWLAYPAAGTAAFFSKEPPPAFSAFLSDRQNREAARFVRGLGDEAAIYSNSPAALYMLTGRRVRGSPRRFYYNSLTPTSDLDAFGWEVAAGGEVYLAWHNYDSGFSRHLYTLKELGALFDHSPVYTGPNFSVYSVRAGKR